MFDGSPGYISFGSVGNVPRWISSSFLITLPSHYTSFVMSFPLDCWPAGTFFCHGLSERCKACFSLNEGLECISRLDTHDHQEGQDGYGGYPTPEQVLAEVSICFKIS